MLASTLRRLAVLLAFAAAPAAAYHPGVIPCDDDRNTCTLDVIGEVSHQCEHRCQVLGRCEPCNAGRCLATAEACRCTKAARCPKGGLSLHTPDGRIVFYRDDPDGPELLRAGGPITPQVVVHTAFHMLAVGQWPATVALQSAADGRYWTVLAGDQLAVEAKAVGPRETFVVRDAGTALPRFVLQAADGSFVQVDGWGLLRAGASYEEATRFAERCLP